MSYRIHLLAATAALALCFGAAAPSAHATALGYGDLIGTWETGTGQPNPTGSNVTTWGNLILAADPGAFLITDFHLAGDTSTWPGTNPSGSLDFFESGTACTGAGTEAGCFNGTWTFLGGVNNNEPVDLFLAVKYSTHVSIFEYTDVVSGDTGTITSDPKVYFGLSSEALAVAAGDVCGHSPGGTNGSFNADCMDLNPPANNPQGISHVVGYWPPGDDPVPEPASLALFGSGLLALGFLRRRSRKS